MSGWVRAQQLNNIKVFQAKEEIILLYDITGGHPGQTFDAAITVSRTGNKDFHMVPQSISGDIKNITPGFNKKIVWTVLDDLKSLTGNDFVFDITLKEQQRENILSTYGMVFVQGGTLQMGCTSEQTLCFDDEKPVHAATLNSYYIGKYEVTQSQWVEIMGNNPSHFKSAYLPVENVSWDEVNEFITKLNQKTGKRFRLPTEAEWEYAARGGNHSKKFLYSGSNSIMEVSWVNSNGERTTHQPGIKEPNELGLYDMTGNVMEWCQDWSGKYGAGHQMNPQGPGTGSEKIVRGGGWFSDARYCRVASRDCKNLASKFSSLGFRLVHPAE